MSPAMRAVTLRSRLSQLRFDLRAASVSGEATKPIRDQIGRAEHALRAISGRK